MTQYTEWRSLVDENPYINTFIDNFESVNSNPRGVYEDNETLEDYYSGDSNTFERVETNRLGGNYSLRGDTSGNDFITSQPGDGLNYYLQRGDKFSCLIDQETSNSYACIVFGAENYSSNGYMALVNPYTSGNAFQVREYDNFDRGDLIDGDDENADANIVYEVVVEWRNDNSIKAEFYDTSSNSLVAEIDTTPDSNFNGRGVGFGNGGTSGNCWWNNYKKL